MQHSQHKGKTHQGVISVTRKGVGYVTVPDASFEDIEVDSKQLGTALNGDTVAVQTTGKNHRGRITGKVTSILERARLTFVGVLEESGGEAFSFRSDDPRFYPKVHIKKDDALGSLPGTKVIIELVHWNSPLTPAQGKVIEAIGKAGLHETEMRASVISRGMKIEFPEAVEKEAEAIDRNRAVPESEITSRRDMRGVPTFTIDPTDAKDFDDAISVRFLDGEKIEVGVHIADVTHYVRPNSALDREARERGTSIYLVDRTIPMLPEVLSNDLCSLKPNVDRLAFSAIFVVNKEAEVMERWFGKTIIHSSHRFTYQSAQEVLDENDETLAREVTTLADLGKHLRAKREKAGALAFETDEVRFELDADNIPVRAYVKERLETMKVIEDWMLLANQEVATWVANHVKDKKPLDQTFLYRIHDVPSSDRVEELRIFLKAIGHELGKGGDIHAKDINTLLKGLRGTPHEAVVNIATLRTMAKAVYSHKNIGHFSLAFKYYTHFTSPIRRYPDMIVHRILFSHLSGTPLSKEELVSYQRAAIDCSEREVAAVEAERESIRYMQLKYMQSRVGQAFTGVVTGVIEAGIFVAEKESRAEGLIHVSTLENDYYTYDQKHYALVGRSSKRRFTLGDEVKRNLVAVDLDERRIDWKLA